MTARVDFNRQAHVGPCGPFGPSGLFFVAGFLRRSLPLTHTPTAASGRNGVVGSSNSASSGSQRSRVVPSGAPSARTVGVCAAAACATWCGVGEPNITVPDSSVIGEVRDCETFWARLGEVAGEG